MNTLSTGVSPGLQLAMSADEYFADPCPSPSLNQSSISDLLDRSPYHFAYRHPRLNPYGEISTSSKAQWLGQTGHRLALGKGREISEIRFPNFKSSSAREAAAMAAANNRIPILTADLVKARVVAQIARARLTKLFQGHPFETEVVCLWTEETQHGRIWCRAMFDAYCPTLNMIADLKFLGTDATAREFGRTGANSGYDVQARFYTRGLGQVQKHLKNGLMLTPYNIFCFVVIETAEPHGSAVFEFGPESLAGAEARVADAMERFAYHLSFRQWPGYPDEIQTVESPAWHLKRSLEG